MNYYNENDPFLADWLDELIKQGSLPMGFVDRRDIRQVDPDDLRPFRQCHFFAGVGGWSYALALAGISSDAPIWTGSCPCQPFSAAGRGKGEDDDRHLWPEFYYLIREARPAAVFGEQIGGKRGEEWFDVVQTDLGRADYLSGAVTFPACSVGAPHLRQRLYWMAYTDSQGLEGLHGDGAYKRGYEDSTGYSAQTSWKYSDRALCADGHTRPIESASCSVAYGVSAGVGRRSYSCSPTAALGTEEQTARKERLSGYGNAVVPQQAAIFIESALEVMAA